MFPATTSGVPRRIDLPKRVPGGYSEHLLEIPHRFDLLYGRRLALCDLSGGLFGLG
jgi:hypothetical protein